MCPLEEGVGVGTCLRMLNQRTSVLELGQMEPERKTKQRKMKNYEVRDT